MEIVQANVNAMKIVNSSDEMCDYFHYTMNSNTLSYFPFTEDFSDKKGNRNLNTRNWVNISGWVLNVTGINSYMVPSSTIWWSIITCGCWYYYTADSSDWWWNTLFARITGTYHHLLFPAKSNNWTIWQVWFYNSWWNAWNITLQKNKWYYLVVVKNWTNQKIYVNWQLAINSNSFNNNTYPIGIICNYNTTWQQWFQWKISDMFFENTEWNQTKIQEQYSKRKWRYQ